MFTFKLFLLALNSLQMRINVCEIGHKCLFGLLLLLLRSERLAGKPLLVLRNQLVLLLCCDSVVAFEEKTSEDSRFGKDIKV